MKSRALWALILLSQGLAGISVGAMATAHIEPSKPAQSITVDAEAAGATPAGETDSARVVDTRPVEVAEIEPAGAEGSDGDGFFSSILRWLEGRSARRDTEGEQAQGRLRQRSNDVKDVTLSHVYQATLDLIAEIHILREATGVTGSPREIVPREDQTPIHAFAKSLEVMEKTARVQRRLGMIPIDVGHIPVRTITPRDSYDNVQAIIEELRRVKRQLVITGEIRPAPFVGGKTPALVYNNLGDASLLLDGLVGRPASSNDVYMRVLQVHDELQLIAAELGVALVSDPLVVDGEKESKDVAQQLMRATYKVINLQLRLGMDASSVPELMLVEVTPAEVLDATNLLLAELARIKVHLDVRAPPAERRASRNQRTRDVFAQVLLIIRNLDSLTRAADDAS